MSIDQVLISKEVRAARQKQWLARHALPLVSFTINMVGEVKNNAIAQAAFRQGRQQIFDQCQSRDISVADCWQADFTTGPELLIALAGPDATEIKMAMLEIEQHHPLGPLFDIDVIGTDGKAISRQDFDHPLRPCLICDQPAKLCARNRTHSLSELITRMSELVHASQ